MADNTRFLKLSAAPGFPVESEYYYDTSLHQLGYWNGTTWVYPLGAAGDTGDIALSGDLGGSTSTPVVVGVQGKAIDAPTTKGDLFVYDGTALKRLGVGSDGNVLTARSTAADGVDWEAAGSGGSPPDNVFIETSGSDLTLKPAADISSLPANGTVSALSEGGARIVKFALTSDGVALSYTLTHNLNTHELLVQGQVNNGGVAGVPYEFDWSPSSANAITVAFSDLGSTPAAGTSYFVTIVG